ncbi:hypothetical protein [Sandaracinus amylolyticus]|uniref:hypothetical protein n=1 Tax=Sandaracinus amylolyticus TaxID=927083 RepID=UPI001F436CB0|nr:hypothetical protein [Sandaracinus amylolyticus]UJR84369.1 Hypothetical protein I5071_64480 [Sandaracinus amylolyticus]
MSAGPTSPKAATYLVTACVFGYWLVAHGVGEMYPISPLGMFRSAMESSSRVVVRRADGTLDEAFDYVDWRCEGDVDTSSSAHPECDDPGYSAQATRVEDHIVSHRGEGEDPVVLVRLGFYAREGDTPIEVRECVLAQCRARRER